MPATPSMSELARVFGRIGMLSFGGPAAQIGLMHRELVETRDWLDEQTYLRALSFCMMLPGPEAMQLATYAGWRLRGTLGGLIAGGLFVLPGALVIAALAALYILFGAQDWAQAMFLGIKATVLVVVLNALITLSRRTLTAPDKWVLAAGAFVAIFAFGLPFPLVIAVAALWGFATSQETRAAPPAAVAHRDTLRTVLIWGAIWLLPLAALWLSGAAFLTQLALFFSQLAVVTFGGAYAVLAYMTQTIVTDHGWLTTAQMIDALGLAETTPGPLILVTQFAGILAGHGAGGWGLAIAAGLVTLWMTFVPCFLWIFAGAPYIEWLAALPRLSGALKAITAAVVGVILSLSLWFALHVLFAQVTTTAFGPLPDWASINPAATALTALAAVLLILARLPLPLVLAAMAAAGLASTLA
ncbi:chromate efflux transporter [Lutimaribacter sp. EGI FJ00015]|uniref:Chromate efflux transporter n=1 Tax=Lutimaribacter degradans TaxID=2945989 RepID=A0ACC5ZU32_9RHOB|nr:chromate efflux transporter [Lutimaribacter sp. EGI FJ00013]MCM2561335.1 chromate efflux transporter [Lutimaribacter sp. EGI FJ00013]MCO0611714.1 chromate efflux transporter [Lutimaribacter sp. EGI FJ00015]MCO0635164.1 chromate efflux transporter [Lutimaribacter sp. EGI FJ00014]